MISHHKIRQFVIAVNLVFLVMSITLFGFNVDRSLAANKSEGWGWGKAQVVTEDIEGKIQETAGNITGSPKDQMMGKAKQVESKARDAANAVDDVKDKMKGKSNAALKSAERKLQQTAGNTTGNIQ
jgi:uncharacterized protein YjbJ (UPF0337 family)